MSRSKRGPTVSQQRLAELRAEHRAEREEIQRAQRELERERNRVEAQLQDLHVAARRREEEAAPEAQLQDLHVVARRREEEERPRQQEGSWDYREAQAQNDLRREEHQRTAQEEFEQRRRASQGEQIWCITFTGRDGEIVASQPRYQESPSPFYVLGDSGIMCGGFFGLQSCCSHWPGRRIFGFSHSEGENYHYLEIDVPQSKSLLPAEDSPRIKRVLEL